MLERTAVMSPAESECDVETMTGICPICILVQSNQMSLETQEPKRSHVVASMHDL